jgi:hypothetical protein
MLARATAICLLAASVVAGVGNAGGLAHQPDLARLCVDDPRKSVATEIRNNDKRTVGELLGIAPGSITIDYRSPDVADVENRVREILAARPRALSAFINWSEGADLRSQGFIVNVQAARLEVAGYQVCVRDGNGNYWYFRNVPVDLWPQ